MADDVKKFFGLPPYNTPDNIVYRDGYFASAFQNRWGMTVEEARRKLGL